MHKIIFRFLLLSLFAPSIGATEASLTPIFISLGSHCNTAHVLRACNLRDASYPFDWITSFDGESFLASLKDDFYGFYDDESFSVFNDKAYLINTQYNFQIPHEGVFFKESYKNNLIQLKEKYRRRYDRFIQLNNCGKKVFFVREAFRGNSDEVHLYDMCELCREISDEFAVRLYKELKSKFPELDFTLIIVNHADGPPLKIDKNIGDQIIFIQTNPKVGLDKVIEAYTVFYSELISQVTIDPPNQN